MKAGCFFVVVMGSHKLEGLFPTLLLFQQIPGLPSKQFAHKFRSFRMPDRLILIPGPPVFGIGGPVVVISLVGKEHHVPETLSLKKQYPEPVRWHRPMHNLSLELSIHFAEGKYTRFQYYPGTGKII
jgi:hypothetical protein